jgi:hypothetical protein
MEEKKATEVKCATCKDSKQIKNTQTLVLTAGGIIFVLALYGLYSIFRDINSLF